MDIACQMQVEILHGDDLRIASARRAALDAEGWALRGLSDHGDDALAQMRAQRLAQPNCGGGLAFSQWGGGDGGHIDVLTVRAFREAVEDLKLDLCLVWTEQFQFVLANAQL